MTQEFRKVAVALAIACVLPAASAAVLTFDDLPGTGPRFFTSNYNGFQFGTNSTADTAWFYTDEATEYNKPSSGTKFIGTDAALYSNGALEPTQPIFSATPFIFNGASFSDGPAMGSPAVDQVQYQLSLGGRIVYTSTATTILGVTPQFIASGFSGLVDSVVILGHQGYYSLDDFTYNEVTAAVPEPETYAMMLAGLIGVTAIVRRRRQR